MFRNLFLPHCINPIRKEQASREPGRNVWTFDPWNTTQATCFRTRPNEPVISCISSRTKEAKAENVDIHFDCATCGVALFVSVMVRVRHPADPFLLRELWPIARHFFFLFSSCVTLLLTYNFLGTVREAHQENTSRLWRLQKVVSGCRPMRRRWTSTMCQQNTWEMGPISVIWQL